MGFFECCNGCTKRYPACSSKCPEYKEQKKLFEARKKIERQRTMVGKAKTDYLNNPVWKKTY